MTYPGLRLFFVVFIAVLYAPALLLPIFAFNDSSIVAFPLSGFTTDWFRDLWRTEELHDATLNSLFVAITSAVLATALGLLAASASVRSRFFGQGAMLGLIMVPMVLPEIIVGMSLLAVVATLGFGLNLWLIVLAHTLICTPFAIAVLRGAFQQLDPSLEEASRDLGESRAMTFWRVTLPLVLPGVISSLLISFTISLDEFIIAFFLQGTETTLPVYIWGNLRLPQRVPMMMALGTVLLVLSIVLLTLAEVIRSRSARRLGQTRSTGAL